MVLGTMVAIVRQHDSSEDGEAPREFAMIHRIVQFSLQQRFLVVMVTVLIIFAGAISFQRMPVDAYPDLSPQMVERITQCPGLRAEAVERRTSPPLELAMNRTPCLAVMRVIRRYGLCHSRLTV